MAILGVLLGVTMTVLGGCIWFARREYAVRLKAEASLVERIAVLERRKAVIQESAVAEQINQRATEAKMRRWSEDLPAAEG